MNCIRFRLSTILIWMTVVVMSLSGEGIDVGWGGITDEQFNHPDRDQYHSYVQVRGDVVDHESGKPIERFSVTFADWGDETGDYNWYPAFRYYFQRQKSNFAVGDWLYHQKYMVIVHAPGYEPFMSKVFDAKEQAKEILWVHADLKKTELMKGRVVDADGKPMANADVLILQEGTGGEGFDAKGGYSQLGMQEDVFFLMNSVNAGMTNEDGWFYVTKPTREYEIAVSSADGYAVIKGDAFKAGDKIEMKKWVRVKGQLKLANEKFDPAKAHMSYRDVKRRRDRFKAIFGDGTAKYVHFTEQSVVNEDGSYVSPKMPAGDYQVEMSYKIEGENYSLPVHVQKTRVGVGECKVLDMGGKGCTINGQLKFGSDEKVENTYYVDLIPKDDGIEFELPAKFNDMNGEARRDWMKHAVNEEAWQAYYEAKELKRYGFTISARAFWEDEFAFKFYDVAEGEYVFDIVGHKKFDVTVKQGEEDGDVYVMDVELQMSGDGVKVKDKRDLSELLADGAVAVETVFGDQLKLSDYRGKYVLVHYWRKWNMKSEEQFARVNEVVEYFSDRDDFAVIGVASGADREVLMGEIAKRRMDWPHIWGDGEYVSDVPTALDCNELGCVLKLPFYALIGKDGKIYKWGLDPYQLAGEVEDAIEGY
ncbi:redoxin domain-containing protein [Planctomycetota bacterium]|nr:redoxin domain-containing protein [Planctomycetota bacterium]